MRANSFLQAQLVLFFAFLACFAKAAEARSEAEGRIFNQNYLEGIYGRLFEYSAIGNARPCPSIIDHFNRGSKSTEGNAWVVPHDKIIEDGQVCADGRSLALNSFDKGSNMPPSVEKIRIARETFELMRQDSTGFWMGADVRKCGRWIFPHPTFVFFVKEFDRSILTSFRVKLGPGKKYMFIVSEHFTCIYEDVPRKAGTTDVEVTGGSSSGSSSSNPTSTEASGTTTVSGDGSPAGSNVASSSGGASNPASTSGTGGSSSGTSSQSPGSSGGSPAVTPTPTESPNGGGAGSSEGSTAAGASSGTASAGDSAGRDPAAAGSSSSANPSSTGDDSGSSSGSPSDDSGGETASPGVSASTDGGSGSDESDPGSSETTTDGDGPSIVDIANGAAPPSATPTPESDTSITDIAPDNGVSVGAEPTEEPGNIDPENPDEEGEGSATITLEPSAGESLCFPGNATVVTRAGRRVRMDRLHVGDEVLARAGGEYSAIFMFSHAERTRMAEFVRLSATRGLAVELTEGHLLYVGGENGARDLKAARDVRVGDTLTDEQGQSRTVLKTETVWRRGVFNPHTVAGDLIVDGIVTSAYTTAFGARCSHTLLAPARGMWRILGSRWVERVVLSEWGRAIAERWIRPLLSGIEKVYA